MSMKFQKDIDWELIPDANCRVRNYDTVNIISIQNYIPLCHLIDERVKYPYDTIHMVMSQS